MFFLSPEIGSADLADPVRRQGIAVDVVKLGWADVEIHGRGIKGSPVSIGIEIKRLSELTSDWDRFAGEQLPKMTVHYDYRWLVWEGEYKENSQGTMLKRGRRGKQSPMHGQNNASSLRKKLLTLEMCGGCHVQHTKDRVDTVRFLADLYHWWTDEDMDTHKSHIVIYEPQGLVQLSDFVRAVAAWPGLGIQRAKAAEKVFRTVSDAAVASVEQWADVETEDDQGKTRKIGMKTATHLKAFLEGR